MRTYRLAILMLPFLLAEAKASPMVQVEQGGRADQPTGTAGKVLIQSTEVEADPCGSPASLPEDLRDLSEENLPPQTNLMRMITEKDPRLNGSASHTKECMKQEPGCGHWFVNPHEPLDGEENDGSGHTTAIMGYSRSLPEYIMQFKIFDKKRYHESAETVAGLSHRNAPDESKAQTELAEHLDAMAKDYKVMLEKSPANRPYPYHDLPLTVSSLETYAKVAKKRARLLWIVACHTEKLAKEDHELEEHLRRNLTSLNYLELKEGEGQEIPEIKMGNSAITAEEKKVAEPQKETYWKDEVTQSFDSFAVAEKPEESNPKFTDDDTLFKRVNHQMRKRELPGMLGPLPMGIGSVDNLKINQEFQLERY
jgi:hypothetical protein